MRADFPRPGEDVAQRQKGESAERSEAEGVHSPQASSPSQALTRQLSQRESHWRNHTLYASAGNFTAMPRPLPLGEVDLRSKDGEGEDTNRRAALSQKAALQLPFSSTTPLVKKMNGKIRRFSRSSNIKIIIPLSMRRAQRRRPPPVAETGRSCWGSGQQDARAAQGTMRMLGAATR